MSTTTLAAPIRVNIAGVHTRPGLGRLVAVELRKMVNTRAGFWLQLATVALTALVVVVRSVVGDAADHTFASVLDVGVKPAAVLLPIVGILLVTSEWSQRTGMITFALVPVRSRVLGAKLIASLVLALAMLVMSVAVVAAGVLVASPGVDGTWSDAATVDRPVGGLPDGRDAHRRRVRRDPARLGARHRRALRTADRVDGARLAVLLRRRRPVAGHAPRPRPAAPGGPERHPVGARRHRARTLDAASAPDRHLADHAAGDRLVTALSPSAAFGQRDALTGEARATRCPFRGATSRSGQCFRMTRCTSLPIGCRRTSRRSARSVRHIASGATESRCRPVTARTTSGCRATPPTSCAPWGTSCGSRLACGKLISEGDSSNWAILIDNGLRNYEDATWGGWGTRAEPTPENPRHFTSSRGRRQDPVRGTAGRLTRRRAGTPR